MNTGCRRKTVCAAVLGVLAFGVAASAAPLQSSDAIGGMKHKGAIQEGPPAGATPITVLDDATRARGTVTSGGVAEVRVFLQGNDSGFGWFAKDDDVFGLGTWATQQIFGNDFEPGMEVSAYDLLVYHSVAADSGTNMDIFAELWTGDPYSMWDTVCADGGVSAPIPDTRCEWTDMPLADELCPSIPAGADTDCAGLYRLRCELPGKTVIPCDRVWTVATMTAGCRATWRIAGSGGQAWNEPAEIGFSDASWRVYGCEQLAACDTPTGYNSGTCCSDHLTPCDHATGNFTCPFNEGVAGNGATFCGDGQADFFTLEVSTTGMAWFSLVSTIYARTDMFFSMAIVSVDAPTLPDPPPPGVLSLREEEVILTEGDHNVWLEFRVGDWDPADIGVQLQAWQATFDSDSLSSGAAGVLQPYTGGAACAGLGDDAPCVAALGTGARCDPAGYYFPSGTCSFAWIDRDHPDFLYKDAGAPIVTIDLSQPSVRPAGTVFSGPPDDPPCNGCTLDEFPAGGMYAGSMAVHVPSDARGTFTMTLRPFPDTQLTDGHNQFIPLLGIRPAKITIQTGRCCYNLQLLYEGGEGCLDFVTAVQCAEQPGLTAFDPDGACNDPCPPVCGDGFINQPGEECDEGANNSDTLPDACRTDCRLSACGDDLVDTGEECDGMDAASCPGACRSNCTCRSCGDGILDPEEECDGADDAACPGHCRSDCTCRVEIPTLSQWGLAALALLLITGVKMWYRRSTAPQL